MNNLKYQKKMLHEKVNTVSLSTIFQSGKIIYQQFNLRKKTLMSMRKLKKLISHLLGIYIRRKIKSFLNIEILLDKRIKNYYLTLYYTIFSI